jgi:hypothetical protein
MPVHPKEEETSGGVGSKLPTSISQPTNNPAPYQINRTNTLTQYLVSSGITDQVAKESSDSNASSHPLHDTDNKTTSGGAATFEHHKANPGPVIADNLGEPASKEELKKRSDELNKK